MRHSKKVAALGVAIVTLLVSGVAFALWSANGSGSGVAKARTAQVVTFADAASPTADLFPAGPAGKLQFKVTNTNPYDVTFTSATLGAVTSSDPTGCPSSNITLAANPVSVSIPVAANASDVAKEIASVVSLVEAAPDTCQGDTFSVAVTLTGMQDDPTP